MNWMVPAQHLGRRIQRPACANGNCTSSGWERWRARRSGVLLNGRWYCCEACLKIGMQPLLAQRSTVLDLERSAHRLPLGLLFLSRGIIDQDELGMALRMKAADPQMRVGECLCRLGLVNEEQVTRALGVQNGLPVLLGYQPQMQRLVPLRLQEMANAYCFRVNTTRAQLYVGFSSTIDLSLVRAIATMLATAVEPCILPSATVRERLAERAETGGSEFVFETAIRQSEIIDSICSYAKQLGVESIRIAHVRQYLWVRLQGDSIHDLLFRRAEAC